jgi:16S rRNA (guanine527-N7)-methyltransferase
MTPPPGRVPLPTCVNDLDELPEAYTATIAAGLTDALGDELEGGVTPAQLEAIGDHARLLMAWNQAINLSGIREPGPIALQHVLDSLTAIPFMRRAGIEEFLDLGSGGGYPGLPLAVALPAKRALLVESVGKKARFLATAAECLGIHDHVRVAATRAETLAADPHHRGQWQAVTARAVTGMGELVELALPLLMVGGLLIAWKRRPAEEELEKAGMALHRVGGRVVRLEAVTVPGLEDHVLAVIEKITETPPQFPRDPAVRRRQPL